MQKFDYKTDVVEELNMRLKVISFSLNLAITRFIDKKG